MTAPKGRKPPITGAESGWYAPDDIDIGSFLYVDADRLIRGLTPGATGKVIKSNGLTPNIPSYEADDTGGGGSSDVVLLGTYSGSAASQIDVVTRNAGSLTGAIFQSDFKIYRFELIRLRSGTNGVTIQYLFSTNGGSSWDTSAIYDNNADVALVNVAAAVSNNSQSAGVLQTNHDNTANYGLNMSLTVVDPLGSAYKEVHGLGGGLDSAGGGTRRINWSPGGNFYRNTTAADAMRFLASSGTITGDIRVYGC